MILGKPRGPARGLAVRCDGPAGLLLSMAGV